MRERIWNLIRNELRLWSRAAPPGIMVLALVIIARLTGGMQFLEWMFLDTILILRPKEAVDERVVIVGIDEKDIDKVGQYPVPDAKIAELLTRLQTYKPRTIGLDIFKNVPVEPGSEQLAQVLSKNTNIIGIEKILPPGETSPPQSLPNNRVGFVDIASDRDSKNRRYLLFTTNPQNLNEDKYSLALRLVIQYLGEPETGKKDPNTIMFGNIELPRITRNFGGYVGANDGGLSILMNFRNHIQPFRIISLRDLESGNVPSEWLRDRIILVGNMHISAGDIFYTSALPGLKLNGQIYGIEYHAQVISQILSNILDKRPMLYSWAEMWEYSWIILWGFVPIIIGRLTQSVWKNLLGVGVAGICLIGGGYMILCIWGVWIPIAPSFLTLAINGVGLSAFAFYHQAQQEKLLRSQLEERQRIIEERQGTIKQAFTIIHNGPLQTIAYVLNNMRGADIPNEQLLSQFEKLNHEIRDIGEYLELEALTQEESLRLGSGLILDLKRPIHDLLYEVYSSTLERHDLESLKTVKIKTRAFEPIDDKYLNMEQKREICHFMEEALCNIGRHAHGAKRIQASGTYAGDKYILCIRDNGCGIQSAVENRGTQHFKTLAKQLGGQFRRESLTPHGTLCELTWTLTPNRRHF